MPELSKRRANALAFSAILLLLAALGLLAWLQFRGAREARRAVDHTYEVVRTANRLAVALREAESSQRGFLLTNRPEYLTPYEEAAGQVEPLLAELRRLTVDNPAQQERLNDVAPSVQQKMEELNQTLELQRIQGPEAALAVVLTNRGQQLMARISATLDALREEETEGLAKGRATAQSAETRARWLALFVATLASGLLAMASRLLARAWQRMQTAEATQRSLLQQMRTAFNSVSQGIGVFGADFSLMRWNDRFPELLNPPDGLREGTPYTELAERLRENAVSLLESEEEIRHGPMPWRPGEPVVFERSRASDGRHFELRRTAMPGGGFVLTISDITERVRQEMMARDGQRLQAMGQLTGGIAHDFNNLLTVVLGNLEMVKARLPPDSPLLARVERAIWGGRRGASLTQQLLAFARRQPLAPAPIDLSGMLPEMVNLLRRTLGEHIEVRVVDAAGLWTVMTDATQLESALLNLALNARDAMPDGGRLTIEVANKVIDSTYAGRHVEVLPGDYVMLAVSDTGHGMPPEVMARAFEPFFTTKGPGKGTGLGLSMVFGFVKQSGGHVKIYSEPGEGTTVKLYLPRAIGAVPLAQRSSAPLVLPRGNATVMVLEDEPAVREVAAEILRELGYRVLEAADGAEALRICESEPQVDLLLADVVLPGGMKGNEVARRLMEKCHGMRILFMSGYTENAIVHHGRLDDGVQLIGKPFSRETLARRVADVLATPATVRGLPEGGS